MTAHASVWLGADPRPTYPALVEDLAVDVVVVGAGISGLTTALLLQQRGRSVAVLDLHRVASGTTGHTTGKVTSQHGLNYHRLLDRRGERIARTYGEANQAGLALVVDLVADLGIDCDLVRAPNYVHTTEARYVERIEREARAAAELGLPAGLAERDEIRLDGVLAGVRFDDQAHFDAAAYCRGLAAAIVSGGGAVHEHTRVTAARERPGRVELRTPDATVRAEQAVITTLMPFVDIGGLFAKARASRAYGLAARIRDPQRVGMYLTTERPTRSTRPWRHAGGTGVIVVGEEHDTGSEVETVQHYTNLETWARANFDVESVEFTWSAQDYITLDDIPYIGRSPLRQRTWVSTGFRKWGLTNASAGALLLAEEICGGRHPWHELYDPGRLGGRRAVARLIGDNAKVAGHYVADWAGRLHAQPLDQLAPGEGGVVRDGVTVCGAYRAPDGTVSKVGLTCTHLGCTVRWNAAETTWDCPCHGSRFAHDGTVLQGPATRDLARRAGSSDEPAPQRR